MGDYPFWSVMKNLHAHILEMKYYTYFKGTCYVKYWTLTHHIKFHKIEIFHICKILFTKTLASLHIQLKYLRIICYFLNTNYKYELIIKLKMDGWTDLQPELIHQDID
jgi:hypothetical protein